MTDAESLMRAHDAYDQIEERFNRLVAAARDQARPADSVRFEAGTAEHLPVATGSVDLIWCRDVLCLCGDLGRAYGESAACCGPAAGR